MVDTMITLHESTEMSFTTNGLGALSDLLLAKLLKKEMVSSNLKWNILSQVSDIRNYSLGVSLWQSQILILTHNHSESMQSQSQLMELLQ